VWTDDDLKRLAAIVAAGGTPLRASAALRRSIAACRNQARKIGTPFTPMQIARKTIKAKCAAAIPFQRQREPPGDIREVHQKGALQEARTFAGKGAVLVPRSS
jgi:hypothetical protein